MTAVLAGGNQEQAFMARRQHFCPRTSTTRVRVRLFHTKRFCAEEARWENKQHE